MLFAEALRAAMFGVFRYSDRSDRLEHWSFAFLTAVLVVGAFIATEMGVRLEGPFLLLLVLAGIWLLLAHVALFVRRLHDHGRTGLYMLLPAAAISLVLIGWLGKNGYVHFQTATFITYGNWIMIAGRVLGGFTISFLLWIFVNEGDPEANAFGDPPL